jgi:hypothetical protein
VAIKQRRYSVVVGQPQNVELAQGEDCAFAFAFAEPVPPLGSGQPIDFTGATGYQLVCKDQQGILLFARLGGLVKAWAPSTAFALTDYCVNNGNVYRLTTAGTSAGSGGPTGTGTSIADGGCVWDFLGTLPQVGDLVFVVTQTDTVTAAAQDYNFDVTFADAQGHQEQLQVASAFLLLDGVHKPGDPITSAPPIPVTYGINWRGAWSSSATYQINDGVTYPDPNGGSSDALSSFRALVVNTNVPPITNLGALSPDWAYIGERGADGRTFVAQDGTPLPVEGIVNVISPLKATDDPSHGRTNLSLATLSGSDGAVLRENEPAATVTFQRLTFDDIDPAFAITSFGGQATVQELGQTLTDPAFTASYNASLSALTIDDGAGALSINLASEASFAYDGGASGLPVRSYVKTAINAGVSWSLSATKLAGPTKTATTSTTWEARAYFGTASIPGLFNQAFITGLPSSGLQPSFANTYAFGAPSGTQYGFLAWPTAFGTPSSFVDPATGFNFPMTRVATSVVVTNGFGVTVSGGYDVWQTTFALLGAASVRAA